MLKALKHYHLSSQHRLRHKEGLVLDNRTNKRMRKRGKRFRRRCRQSDSLETRIRCAQEENKERMRLGVYSMQSDQAMSETDRRNRDLVRSLDKRQGDQGGRRKRRRRRRRQRSDSGRRLTKEERRKLRREQRRQEKQRAKDAIREQRRRERKSLKLRHGRAGRAHLTRHSKQGTAGTACVAGHGWHGTAHVAGTAGTINPGTSVAF